MSPRVVTSRGGLLSAVVAFVVACGGTSVSHDGNGMPGTGGTGGTGGSGGDAGGIATGGTGGTGASGGDAGGVATGGTGAIGGTGGTACCTSDGQCSHATCSPDDPGCARSVCVKTECKSNSVGQCWRDDQCAAGQACSSAFVCGCAADCDRSDQPGVCVPKGPNCCLSDADCGQGTCVQGVCEVAPAGYCYETRDCPAGGFCNDASVCPCGSACLVADHPGTCVYPL